MRLDLIIFVIANLIFIITATVALANAVYLLKYGLDYPIEEAAFIASIILFLACVLGELALWRLYLIG